MNTEENRLMEERGVGDLRAVRRTELATFFDVSPRTISNWIDAGCPVASRRTKSKHVHWFIIEEVIIWRLKSQDPSNGGLTSKGALDLDFKLNLLKFCQETADKVCGFLDQNLGNHEYSRDGVNSGAVQVMLLQNGQLANLFGDQMWDLLTMPTALLNDQAKANM